MPEEYYLYFVLLLLPAIMITGGLILVFKKDWAWWFVGRMLSHVKAQRTPEWESSVTINGVIMLVMGAGTILYILCRLPTLLRPGG